MAINFPANPSNGDVHAGFTYNSTKSVWEANSPSMMATSDTAPTSPSDGQMWFDTDGGGTFVYYEDTDSSQWVEVIGSQGSPGADGATGADGGAGVASVYATVNDLPTSGNSQGDMAHVTANNTLYFWNGSGWYKIALINTSPSISGVNSSYDLAIDGTATVVTVTATDPEGLPITYSIASDTSGNIATVTQGTDASSNVFTITPSTSDANAGSFTLTFRASDGVNLATAPASFTLEFKVVNSNYTTALITATDNGYVSNKVFRDSSGNNHSITVVGDTTQTTFSPYRHGGYSTYFDGSGDYLQPAGTTIFDISSSTASFTVEAWINPSALPSAGAYNYRFGSIISKGVVYVSFGFTSNGTLRFYTYSGAENYINSASGVIEVGKWQHVALVSDAGSVTLYKDGVSVATGTLVAPQAAGIGVAPKIATGDPAQAADFINSYVSDLRVVDGTAVYTSNFTPPTDRLTAITNTSLLTCHLPYIVDGSTNAHSITVNGNTKTAPFAPYDSLKYVAADHGGSAFFDGSGDKLTIPGTYANFGTNPFTVEAWVYPSSSVGPIFTTHRAGTASGFYFSMSTTNNTIIHGRYFGSNVETASSANAVKLNQWNHFAWCREGTGSNQTRMFANGKVVATYTDDQDYSSAPYGPFVGGYDPGGLQYDLPGNIADLRVVSGTALYTAEFTPPTAPLTAVTNTSLLLPFDDATIIDKSQSIKNITLNGDTTISSTQTKHLNYSMYFDGTGDYIQSAYDAELFNRITFPSGVDFTVEAWIYMNTAHSVNHSPLIVGAGDGVDASPAHYFNWGLYFSTSGTTLNFGKYNGSTFTGYSKTHSISATTWTHVAVTRNGTDLKFFVDGTQLGATETDSTNWSGIANFPLSIGRWYHSGGTADDLDGYLSDIRITKGLARYTANFTPPAEALKG